MGEKGPRVAVFKEDARLGVGAKDSTDLVEIFSGFGFPGMTTENGGVEGVEYLVL